MAKSDPTLVAQLRGTVGRFAGQVMLASVVTAAVGASALSAYEFLFDPEAYAAGPLLARLAFGFVVILPFILVGLVVVGAPVAVLLRRLDFDNPVVFGVAGALAGGAIGLMLVGGLPRMQAIFAVFGCMSAVAYWVVGRHVR